jgi:hypothetical protein
MRTLVSPSFSNSARQTAWRGSSDMIPPPRNLCSDAYNLRLSSAVLGVLSYVWISYLWSPRLCSGTMASQVPNLLELHRIRQYLVSYW